MTSQDILGDQPSGTKYTTKKATSYLIHSSRAVEYQAGDRQWYYIQQDMLGSHTTSAVITRILGLGRQSIHHSTTQAADIDDTEEGHAQSPYQAHQYNSMATTMQTTAGTIQPLRSPSEPATNPPQTTQQPHHVSCAELQPAGKSKQGFLVGRKTQEKLDT